MKNFLKSLLILFMVVAATGIAAAQPPKRGYQELDPKSFRAALTKTRGIVLDVRTPEEYQDGHLPQARNIDYKNDAFRTQINKLDKTKHYFVYCKTGVRSANAADLMKELGFKQVYTLEGGIEAWKEDQLKTVK